MMKKFDHINVRITPHIDFVFCSIWYYGTELSPKKKKLLSDCFIYEYISQLSMQFITLHPHLRTWWGKTRSCNIFCHNNLPYFSQLDLLSYLIDIQLNSVHI